MLSLLAWLVVAPAGRAAAGPLRPPLPGLEPGSAAASVTNAPVYGYDSASDLRSIKPNDPRLKPAALGALLDHSQYQPGTVEHLLSRWRDYLNGGGTLSWTKYRDRYVTLRNNKVRGKAFEEFFRQREKLTEADGWSFDRKIPDTTSSRRADAFNEDMGRAYELKSGSGVRKDQLADNVKAVDETQVQVVYVFGTKPTAAALKAIREANLATAVNREAVAAGHPVQPMIVARYWPALAQELRNGTATAGGAGPGTATGGATAGTGSGGAPDVLSDGAQQPVDGPLDEAIENSADSPQDAKELSKVDGQLVEDFGEDAVPDPDTLGGIDFSSLELRYVSDSYNGGAGLRYAFSADPSTGDQPSYGGRAAAQLASDSFFTWLEIPTDRFTVNLNPDEPERIIDAQFGRTDAGRVLLEADLQLKKSVGTLINPDTPLGKRYWDALQGDNKCVSMRQWIVPGPATVREDGGQLYILDAPLQVKMETEYLKTQGVGSDLGVSCGAQGTSVERNNEAVYRSMILPLVEKAVNTAPEYADLRRVYVSRVAAEWYRQRSRTKHTAYSDLIDKDDIDRWLARTPWTPQDVYQRYLQSYTKGEFTIKHQTRKGNMIYTETYVYGGVDFSGLTLDGVGAGAFANRAPALPATTDAALYGAADDQAGHRVWLGGMSAPTRLTSVVAAPPAPPTSRPLFYVLLALPVMAWFAGGVVLVLRRRGRPPLRPLAVSTVVGR